MTQFGAAKESAREWERCWNVLKTETFLIVHSLGPYVTQTDHVMELCSSRGKPKHYLRHSCSNLIMQALCLHNSTQTDKHEDREINRQRNRVGDVKIIISGTDGEGGVTLVKVEAKLERLFVYIN